MALPRLVPKELDPVHHLRVMGRFVRRHLKKPGLPPGTVVHTGPKKEERARVSYIDYDAQHATEREDVADLAVLWGLRDSPSVSWVNVDGLHDTALIERIGERFGIHPLVLEDIVSTGQRPKLEEHEEYLYVVVPMLSIDASTGTVHEEQVSVVLGPTWVLTFQERSGDVFDPVRERIRGPAGRLKSRGADYLAYALVDAVVDHYFTVLEAIGDAAERMELEVIEEPTGETMNRLHALKREMLMVRRAVWPVRDMLNGLMRTESRLVTEGTKVFLRDVYDHAVRIIDTVEVLRDVTSGMIDLYLSNVSHRTNEVMKTLTVVASIFIPLTFIVGLYGMNFDYMPELDIPWAYPALVGLMVVLAAAMVWHFRRRGWL